MPSGVYERTKLNCSNIAKAVKKMWDNPHYAMIVNAHKYKTIIKGWE